MELYNKDIFQDFKLFIDSSKQHFCSLLKQIDFNTNFSQSKLNMDTIINCLKENTMPSNKSDILLPPSLNVHLLPHPELKFCMDSDARKLLLNNLRGDCSIPPPAQTADEYQASYTSIEKNVFYEHAMKNTIKIETPPELSIDDVLCSENDSKAGDDIGPPSVDKDRTTRLFSLKAQRDLKRRRTAYRRKISLKNKTAVQVTREMISNIMEALFGDAGSTHQESPNRDEVLHDDCLQRHRLRDDHETRHRSRDYVETRHRSRNDQETREDGETRDRSREDQETHYKLRNDETRHRPRDEKTRHRSRDNGEPHKRSRSSDKDRKRSRHTYGERKEYNNEHKRKHYDH